MRRIWIAMLALILGLTFFAQAETETSIYDGNLIIKDGLLQPMLNMTAFSDPYVNREDNGILRF